MATIPHPTAVFVRRNDRPNNTQDTAAKSETWNARLPVHVGIETAPLPPQPTLDAGVGKGPNRQVAHIWRFQTLNIQAIHAIMAPNFIMGKGDPTLVRKGMPRGVFQPMVERTNIDKPNQTTQGARVETQPNLVIAPQYIKLV